MDLCVVWFGYEISSTKAVLYLKFIIIKYRRSFVYKKSLQPIKWMKAGNLLIVILFAPRWNNVIRSCIGN